MWTQLGIFRRSFEGLDEGRRAWRRDVGCSSAERTSRVRGGNRGHVGGMVVVERHNAVTEAWSTRNHNLPGIFRPTVALFADVVTFLKAPSRSHSHLCVLWVKTRSYRSGGTTVSIPSWRHCLRIHAMLYPIPLYL